MSTERQIVCDGCWFCQDCIRRIREFVATSGPSVLVEVPYQANVEYPKAWDDQQAHIDRLTAENAELRKDKERLDWLANEADREMNGKQHELSLFRRNSPITRETIDANIDAALAGGKP